MAAKYETLFLRQLELESECECTIPQVEAVRRERFSAAGAIFPTYHY
jgi:hypothetical protein